MVGKIAEMLDDIDKAFGKYKINELTKLIKEKSELIIPQSDNSFMINKFIYNIDIVKIDNKKYINIGKYINKYDEKLLTIWNEIVNNEKVGIMSELKEILNNFDYIEKNKDVLIINRNDNNYRLNLEYEYGYGFDDWPLGTEDFSNPIIEVYYNGYKVDNIDILDKLQVILNIFGDDVEFNIIM